jgi:putative component of toxin-antitoxin plasmid stabilization module
MPELSGKHCTVYSAIIDNVSPFEQFVDDYFVSYGEEVEDILSKIQVIGRVGAIEPYFKMYEGKYGDGVCALYDDDEQRLRLYCIRFDEEILILGGGGSKVVRKWQDDPDLKKNAEKMIEVSKRITDFLRKKSSEIHWSENEFSGDLVK